VNQPTSAALPSPLPVSPCAATALFNLPDYRVLEVRRSDDGHRTVSLVATQREAACPSCGVLTSRVHQRTEQRLRDVPFDGVVTVLWVKRRWRCSDARCTRTSFAEHTDQVPPRARMTTRLREALVEAVAGEARPVDRVAAQFGVSWPTVMRQLSNAMALLTAQHRSRPRLVRRLGIDEHRFRTVRWFRDSDEPARWRRIEPWMTCMVDLSSQNIIDIVDGRDSAAVRGWLEGQPKWWRRRVEVVAIDPSAAFRSAVRRLLPKARVSVDHFHLVKLANDMLTAVRRRVSWDRHNRRGRQVDPAWAHRLLLLRGYDTLTERGRTRLTEVLADDDPTREIGAAWGVKEQLRRLLATTTLAEARAARRDFDKYVAWAAEPETTRLKKTIDAWWPEIETFILTRVTNARTEAANVTVKNIKRTGRGYRSAANYRCRIMAYNVARSAT
jgi:transposase